jgi:hypothetical protein
LIKTKIIQSTKTLQNGMAMAVNFTDGLAVPVSNIEGEADCPPNINHLYRGQGHDQ